MKYTEFINNDIKVAMLARDKTKLEALRAVKTAFTIASSGKAQVENLSDEEELQIIQKLIKQRNDSAQIYKEQNRPDLLEQEVAQSAIIGQYLPPQMDIAEIESTIGEIIKQTNANGIKDMGKVMGIASKQLQGKTDNKTISEVVKKLLS